jgi:hypothetical protein
VVVNNFDIMSVSGFPNKTDAPLIVNTDAVLPFPIARQRMEPIPRGYFQVRKKLCGVQH